MNKGRETITGRHNKRGNRETEKENDEANEEIVKSRMRGYRREHGGMR